MRRDLWQPELPDQIAAVETLLATSIPYPLRLALRERHEQLSKTCALRVPEQSPSLCAGHQTRRAA